MLIDCHCHWGKLPFPMVDRDIDALWANFRRFGIDIAIMSSAEAILYDMQRGNADLAAQIQGRPQFYGLVVINANYVAQSLAELDKYLPQAKFVGAKAHPEYTNVRLGSPEWDTLAQAVKGYGVPLKFHTWVGDAGPLLQMARKHPDLTIIMGHNCGFDWRKAAEAAAQVDNLVMEFCSSWPDRHKVRDCIEIAGPEKAVFGSDIDLISPAFTMGLFEEADLTEDERELVFWKNACRIFGLRP
jgi:predicted TIM-barrel fold metal-dependent hydrolase